MICFISKYIIFAILSTIINLLTQYISFLIYDGIFAVYPAMFLGTLTGLIVKYVLDKKYIFYHKTISNSDNNKMFVLYSFMGIFTTLIFWCFEVCFNLFFHDAYSKYLGALIGLSIGYVIKYNLDKKFVFKVNNEFN